MEAGGVIAQKQAIRGELRTALRALRDDAEQRAERSSLVVARLCRLVAAHPDVASAMVFRALPSEPQLGAFVEWCDGAGITVVAPRVAGTELEPEGYASGADSGIAVGELDLVLVPGLAFTPDGRRLGRGGGHFDRFLPRLRSDCLTVGVCFAEQLRDDLPTEPHDVAVDRVVSA